MYVWFIPQSYKNKNTTLSGQVKKNKRQISLGHVHQCTRLKMSAVTLLPVFPPNWKVGVGNSSTNTNPVKQHREKVQVKKYSFLQTTGASTCLEHRSHVSFRADYGLRGVWRSTAIQTNFPCHCLVFPGPSKDREPFSKYPLHSLPSHFHLVCTSLQKIRQIMSHLKPITLERKWLTKPSHRESADLLTTCKTVVCPSWKDFCIKADYVFKLCLLQSRH